MVNTTNKQLALIAGTGSALLLLAALSFQYMGYAPCELCILQRWPHLACVVIAAVIAIFGWTRSLAILGLIAILIAIGLAVFHSGVELKWWQGPTHCSGGISNLTQLSTADLLTQLEAAPVVRCDEAAWRFIGFSMASWNAICSAIIAIFWAMSAFRRPIA